MTDDLTAFLRARLDEDEAIARAVSGGRTWTAYLEGGGDGWAIESEATGEPSWTVGDESSTHHIARHDPARVLREVEAKREAFRDLEPHQQDDWWLLRLLAFVYSDHPDYREEWRP